MDTYFRRRAKGQRMSPEEIRREWRAAREPPPPSRDQD